LPYEHREIRAGALTNCELVVGVRIVAAWRAEHSSPSS